MILIIGCGRLGGSLAVQLASEGVSVTVLEHDRPHIDANLPADFPGRVVVGMEIDDDVLTRAGIREAEAVAAVARDESTNIMAAEVAKNVFHVPRVVVRIDEPELAELYRKQGYEVISPIVEATQTLNRTLRPKEAS